MWYIYHQGGGDITEMENSYYGVLLRFITVYYGYYGVLLRILRGFSLWKVNEFEIHSIKAPKTFRFEKYRDF